jgi:hypothetical protein
MRSQLVRLVNRFSQLSPALVAILAIVGILVSILFLVWTRIAEDVGDRANVSVAVATMFALFAAIAAVTSLVWVEGSDFKAQQNVKSDTARLRSALRSIMIKTVILRQFSDKPGHQTCIDFESERATIEEFLNSTSAFGYWAWVEKRGAEAKKARKTTGKKVNNPWGLFFAELARLLETCDPDGMTYHAVQLEKYLARLKRRDVHRISGAMADLTGILGTAEESADPLLASVMNVYDK